MVRSVTEPVAGQIVALIGQSFHYLGKINWVRVGLLFLKKVCIARFFFPLFTHFLRVNIAIFAKLKKKRLFKT
jgi:hypothetical protein